MQTKSYPHRGTKGGGRLVLMKPLPRVIDKLGVSKRLYFYWKAFVLSYKMRYILSVVALLEEGDVAKHDRHVGFYRELEIR